MYNSEEIKQIIQDRLIQREVQLMRAEDNEIKQEVITMLHAGVKELRYLWKLLFNNDLKEKK